MSLEEHARTDRGTDAGRGAAFLLANLIESGTAANPNPFLVPPPLRAGGNHSPVALLDFIAMIEKATVANPAARYESTAAFSNDISAYLDGLPVSAYPEGLLGTAWRWMVRNRVWLLMVLAYLVMRTILILWRSR